MPDNTQTTIKMAHIIDYWTETTTRRNENVTTGMDLYYLSHQSMQELHKNGHFVIAGMDQGRFTALTTMLNREQKAPNTTICIQQSNKRDCEIPLQHSYLYRQEIGVGTAFHILPNK